MKSLAATLVITFIFCDTKVNELSFTHKKYPGFRISITGKVGQIRNKVSIDIGVGDVVRPRVIEIELLKASQPLFEDSISLIAYPPKYIFSEKLARIFHKIYAISLDLCFYNEFSSFGNTTSISLTQKFHCRKKSLRDIFVIL